MKDEFCRYATKAFLRIKTQTKPALGLVFLSVTPVKIKRILRLIAINVASFAILLVAVNWLCGIYLQESSKISRHELPNYENDREHAEAVFHDYGRVQHQYEPFVGWKMLPYQGKTLTVSDNGHRAIPTGTPGERTATVRFFGGSTMWGEGSDDNHTIPALFSAANPQYKVYNHAQLAYNSRQELDELISMYSRDEKADLVIFYDGVNDAAFLCPRDITQLPAHRLVPMYREKLYVGKTAVIKEIAGKLFIENILKAIHKFTYKPQEGDSPYDCVSNPEKAEQIAEMMITNWEMAHEIVTRRNGKFIAVLQPAAYIGRPRTDHLELDPELGKNFETIYSRLKAKIAQRNHSWIVDLSDRFDGDEYIYIDFCHVSPNGNAIIAREISSAVRSLENQHVAVSLIYP